MYIWRSGCQQSNIAASTAILAGLVLEKEVIKRILRSDIMRESVIYQDILEEGKAEALFEVARNLINTGMASAFICLEKFCAGKPGRANFSLRLSSSIGG